MKRLRGGGTMLVDAEAAITYLRQRYRVAVTVAAFDKWVKRRGIKPESRVRGRQMYHLGRIDAAFEADEKKRSGAPPGSATSVEPAHPNTA